MRYVNKLSYQGVPPITKKAVFQVGRVVVPTSLPTDETPEDK